MRLRRSRPLRRLRRLKRLSRRRRPRRPRRSFSRLLILPGSLPTPVPAVAQGAAPPPASRSVPNASSPAVAPALAAPSAPAALSAPPVPSVPETQVAGAAPAKVDPAASMAITAAHPTMSTHQACEFLVQQAAHAAGRGPGMAVTPVLAFCQPGPYAHSPTHRRRQCGRGGGGRAFSVGGRGSSSSCSRAGDGAADMNIYRPTHGETSALDSAELVRKLVPVCFQKLFAATLFMHIYDSCVKTT